MPIRPMFLAERTKEYRDTFTTFAVLGARIITKVTGITVVVHQQTERKANKQYQTHALAF